MDQAAMTIRAVPGRGILRVRVDYPPGQKAAGLALLRDAFPLLDALDSGLRRGAPPAPAAHTSVPGDAG